MKLFSTSKVIPILACAMVGSASAGTCTKAPCCPPPAAGCEAGWTLGLEAMALRPFHGEGLYRDSDFDFGGRVSLGYQFDDCLFARLTYFGYGGEATADFTGTPLNVDTEVSYWDLVVGQTFHPSEKLAVAASVGLRQASFEEDLTAPGGFINTEYNGFGIVVGLDATRKLNGPWSLYVTAKQSLVFGQSDVSASTPIAGLGDNTVLSITELGGGIQYDFAMGNIDANIRAGVEGQYWADPSVSLGGGTPGTSRTSYGLAGFVLGANFRF